MIFFSCQKNALHRQRKLDRKMIFWGQGQILDFFSNFYMTLHRKLIPTGNAKSSDDIYQPPILPVGGPAIFSLNMKKNLSYYSGATKYQSSRPCIGSSL